MSFRNGDKARSGRLHKQRNQMRLKTRALRAELIKPAAASSEGGVAKSVAEGIGSALGTIVAATQLSSSEA